MKWFSYLGIASLGIALGNSIALLNAGSAQAVIIDFNENSIISNVCGADLDSSGRVLSGCDELTDQYKADFGLTFETSTKELWLFDTSCKAGRSISQGGCTGDDPDLATGKRNYNFDVGNLRVKYDTPDQGNALIIQENVGSRKQPDDNAARGTISLLFDDPVDFKNIGFLDLDEASQPKFTLFFADGSNTGQLQFDDSDAEVSIVTGTGSLGAGVSSQEKSRNGGSWQLNKNNSLRNYTLEYDDVVKVRVRLPGSGAIPYVEFEQQEVVAVPEPTSMIGLSLVGLSLLIRKKLTA